MERHAILQKRKALRLDEQLLRCKGVIGIDVENKRVNGKKTDRLCLKVYVKKKLQLQQLSAEEVIPPTINDIPTDVDECTYLWGPSKRRAADVDSLQADTLQGTDILEGGLSIGNQYDPVGYGTLGIVLSWKGAPTAVSCAHVMVDPKQSPEKAQDCYC